MNIVTLLSVLLLISLPLSRAYGREVTRDEETEWDFIVVGAGASGSVVAAR
jgi:hypothetical protein